MAEDIARGNAPTDAGDSARGAMTISTTRSASATIASEIADVTNYIRNAGGNAAPLVTAAEVANARRK